MTPDLFGHKIRQQAPVYCVYHRVDFDGQCSAAIVRRNTKDCTLIGYNYAEPFPWYVFEQANRRPTCYMVDVSLSIDDMKKLAGLCDLVWIDHHKSVIDVAKAVDFNPPGARDHLFSGCELTWGWFHGNMANIPIAVHLLGRYDVWDHGDPRVLPFQYYMRAYRDASPENTEFWTSVFELADPTLSKCIGLGARLFDYQMAINYQNSTQYSFETRLFGHKTLACNTLRPSSQFFESDERAKDCPLWCAFYWRHKVGWTITLYTIDKTIDVGDIARRMGGGGHRGAAGYTVSQLPEELQSIQDNSHIKGTY